jgi:hypothetical protein
MVKIPKQEIDDLIDGILAGDGDVGSRMASSVGGEPPYPGLLSNAVSYLNRFIDENGLPDEQQAATLKENVFKVLHFPDSGVEVDPKMYADDEYLNWMQGDDLEEDD